MRDPKYATEGFFFYFYDIFFSIYFELRSPVVHNLMEGVPGWWWKEEELLTMAKWLLQFLDDTVRVQVYCVRSLWLS